MTLANSIVRASALAETSVSAVVVTRDRTALLRKTLASIRASSHPPAEIIVSDDSTGSATLEMLKEEFPDVRWVAGPRKGISANRNHGIKFVSSQNILLSDDDMLVSKDFVELALLEMERTQANLVFTGTSDHGVVIFPNTFDFLGFASKPYAPGQPYNTANQQCFMMKTTLARELPYDGIIASYGYEEMDYAYRVAAAGHRIGCIQSCANIHLDPNSDKPFRFEQDACRIYVTYKRLAYVNRQPVKAVMFLAVALPHHLLSRIRRSGFSLGCVQGISNFRLAYGMLKTFRVQHRRMDVHQGESRDTANQAEQAFNGPR